MGGSVAARSPLRVLLGMVVLGVSASQVMGLEEPPEHFLFQGQGECHYTNGAQRVRTVARYFFNRQELVYFDSDLGKIVAVAELMEPDAELWNKDKVLMRRTMANVDRFCRDSFDINGPFAHSRRVQPRVLITPTEYDPVSRNALLTCSVGSFYPKKIEIKWFRNGKELDEATVWTTDVIRNGDWTFQIEVQLETQPERGDVYACRVDHASLEGPVTVQWEAESPSSRSKRWMGIVGIVLGLVFVAPGLFLCLKNKKDEVVNHSTDLATPGILYDLKKFPFSTQRTAIFPGQEDADRSGTLEAQKD